MTTTIKKIYKRNSSGRHYLAYVRETTVIGNTITGRSMLSHRCKGLI